MELGRELVPGDVERFKWKKVPCELLGKSVSLEDLNNLFQGGIGVSGIEVFCDKKKYKVYGRQDSYGNFKESIAYECKKCCKIIVGLPIIIDDISLRTGVAEGREGYEIHCRNCNELLDEHTFAKS